MEEVVQGYKGSKRKRYETALKDYKTKKLHYLHMVENKNERFRSCFVKEEQLYKTKQGLTEQFSSRVISGVCSYSISLLQQCFIKST